MALANMMNNYKDELICDLAETYHLYDWRAAPLTTVAALAVGLRAGSRVKAKMAGMPDGYTLENMLSARICDELSFLSWTKTKDSQKNKNRPRSIVALMTGEKKEPEGAAFDTAEEFEAERRRILAGLEG